MPSFILVIIVCALTTLFWDQPILLPLKLLVVLVHEFSHGVVALLFSAELEQVKINTIEQGHTIIHRLHSSTGFIFTASAGYLGTAFLGSIFLNRALEEKNQRFILMLFTIFLAFMSYLFCSLGSIAFLTGMGFSLLLIMFSLFMREIFIHWLLIVIGSFFIWYSFCDLLDFTQSSATDATILANYLTNIGWIEVANISLTAQFFAVLWTIMITIMSALAIVFGFQHSKHTPTINAEDQSLDVPPSNSAELSDVTSLPSEQQDSVHRY